MGLGAIDQNATAVESVGAKDRPRHLGAAGPDQPGDAKNLAAANLQIDIIEDRRVRILRVSAAAERLDFEHDATKLRPFHHGRRIR